MTSIAIVDDRTDEDRQRPFLPGMGRSWLMPVYDVFTRLTGMRRVYDRTAQAAGIGAGDRVLDVGAGTGNLSLAVLRLTPGARVTAHDPDAGALRRAGRKARRRGVPLTLVQGYAHRLPAEDSSVDQVITSLALHHVDDDGRTVFGREARRVLRPGGSVTVADFGSTGHGDGHGHGHAHGHHAHGALGHVRGLARRLRARPTPAINEHVARNMDNGIVRLLRDAGFTDAREIDRIDHRVGPITIVRATAPE